MRVGRGGQSEGRQALRWAESLGCSAVGLRSQEQDARKDGGDGGLFPEKEQWPFFH